MPIEFKRWDQNPSLEKSVDEIIQMYEGGFAAALYSEEENERLIAECGNRYAEDIAHAYGFADTGKGKLITPFTHVMDAYPLAWPGKGQTIGSCFRPGKMVTMADGSKKPIEQMSIGDEVITHKGNVKKVTHLVNQPAKDGLVEITVKGTDRYLEATPDHKIPVLTSEYEPQNVVFKRMDEIRLCDYLLIEEEHSTVGNLHIGCPVAIEAINRVEYDGPTHCITVEDDHSFICDGFSVSNCVQNCMINAELGTMVLESVLGKPDEETGKLEGCPEVSKEAEKSTVLAFEPGYWFRGSSQDGWYCAAAARVAVTQCGAIIRKDYPDLGVNLEKYSAKLAHKYGRMAPSQDVIDKLNNNLFRNATEAKTFEAIRDFLNRGFFVTSCGSEGFSNKRDSNGVAKRKGSWAHAMCIIGADDRPEIHSKYGEPLLLVLNSWAIWNTGSRKILGTDIEIPEGAFWARWSDVKNRYYAAISGLNGWERKNLPDFRPDWSPDAV